MRTVLAWIAALFLLCSCVTMAQTTRLGGRLSEITVQGYNGEDVFGIFNNDQETFLVMWKNPTLSGVRILYRKGAGNFTDIDLSLLKNAAGPKEATAQSDGLYFTTYVQGSGCGGGSYRIRAGKVEALVVNGQMIDLVGPDGKTKSAKVTCYSIANPVAGADALMWLNLFFSTDNTSYAAAVNKQGSLFTVLFQTFLIAQKANYPYPYVVGYPYWGTGVWGKDTDLYFSRDMPDFLYLSHFNSVTKKFTDIFWVDDTNTYNGQLVAKWSYAIDQSNGELFMNIKTNDGVNHIVLLSTMEELFQISGPYPEFGSVDSIVLGSISRQMALAEISPVDKYEGVGMWNGDKMNILLKNGDVLPSGKIIRNLGSMYPTFSVAGCVGDILTFQPNSMKLDALVEFRTPCIMDTNLTWTEGSTVTLNGKDFTLGSNKPDVQINGVSVLSVLDSTGTKLTFTSPSRCDSCTVRVVSGQYTSNTVKVSINTPDPVVTAITNLYGDKINLSPYQIVSLFGHNFSTVRTVEAVIPPDLRRESSTGTSILLDGKPIGISFEFTNPVGSSQANILLPYDLPNGSHEIVVRSRTFGSNVITSSAPFRFTSESVSPMFWTFKLAGETLLTAQNPSQVYYDQFNNSVIPLVTPDRPAMQGDVLVCYLTGGGQTMTAQPDLGAVQSPLIAPVKVTVSGSDATVLYAGAQGSFPGLQQINFIVPFVTTSGATQVKIQVGDKVQPFTLYLK